jgi:hypothetical protein
MDPCAITFEIPDGYFVRRLNPGWAVFHGSVLIHSGFKTENMARLYASAFDHGFQIGAQPI